MKMTLKTKAGILVVLIAVLWVLMFSLSQFEGFVTFYSAHIYPPIQSGRLFVFGFIPFSMGDVFYVLLGVWLLLTIIRWIYYLRKFGAFKDKLAGSVLNTINVALLIYILFLVGWGANYSKPPLGKSWGIPPLKKEEKKQRREKDKVSTIAFNRFLVERLNAYAPKYVRLPYDHINDRAVAYYREFTDSKVKQNGLGIKATLFSFFMQRMAVDGYYNPFTGEGQANKQVPLFMMPFILSHEMAHQAGIAAEGDANLMAYALCTRVTDATFRYSAYLNLWLYANNRLYRHDSSLANSYAKQLNPLTRSHLDTLEQISKQYHGSMTRYTSGIYDSYLRMQNQEGGISSYGNVTREAWLLEQGSVKWRHGVIKVP
jgi:hypothetical protein